MNIVITSEDMYKNHVGEVLCPPCGGKARFSNLDELLEHISKEYEIGEPKHIEWVSRYILKENSQKDDIRNLLNVYFDSGKLGIARWIRTKFIDIFYGNKPHPFVISMQSPSRYIIMGYVTEHYHFLKNWIRCCSFIMAKTEYFDVQTYEFNNIKEEFFGDNEKPGHIELLLRMGESVGLNRGRVINTRPLDGTREAIGFWYETAKSGHWLDSMVSMHSLELIADRTIREDGASIGYFSEKLFQSDLPDQVKEFLRAGYEADQYHSMDALRLVEYYARELNMEEEVKSYFLTSSQYFWDYLNSRVLRGEMYEKEL